MMKVLGNFPQTARAVVNRVHRRDDGEEHLRRANVTRSFVAANVLLARLQCEPVRGPAFGVVRNTDESTGHVAFVLIARRKISGVRSAETKGDTKALCASNCNVGAEFARRFYQRKRQNIGCDNDERAGVVCLFNKLGVVINRAVGRRILDERAENGIVQFEPREVVDLNLDSERFRAGADDFDCLRMAIVGDEKSFSIGNGGVTKRHRFGCGGRFVEQRCVRDVELGQIDDHRLKIEQRFEPALRELGLVGRVGGVPARIFENIALNDRRSDAIVIASADKRARDFVF